MKIILIKENVQVEGNSEEVALLLKKLYWKNFNKEEVIVKVKRTHSRTRHIHLLGKSCIKCNQPIKGKSKSKKYCDECKKIRIYETKHAWAIKNGRIKDVKTIVEESINTPFNAPWASAK